MPPSDAPLTDAWAAMQEIVLFWRVSLTAIALILTVSEFVGNPTLSMAYGKPGRTRKPRNFNRLSGN
jgi:hypothetical protein